MVSNSSTVQSAIQTSQRILSANMEATAKSASRLATGRKINSAADGAAELQQIARLSSQLNGSQKALEQIQDTNNVLNIADGALSSSSGLLQRARELTLQAANDTNGPDQRAAIQNELGQITQELDRIGNTTSFNGRQLLDGSQGSFSAVTDADGNTIDISASFGDSRASALGVNSLDVSSSASARASLESIDAALTRVNEQRSTIGSTQNRLEATADNQAIYSQNVTEARSRYQDVDFAAEVSKLSSLSIQSQVAAAVQVQAMKSVSGVAALLQG